MNKEDVVLGMRFEVADVRKPLLSVQRIREQGNLVCFGPEKDDNFIQNKRTGNKLALEPQGTGSFVLRTKFVGGIDTEITVDSGAEESVCPWEWGEEFGLWESDKWLNLVGANGSPIEHYGMREIKVVSPF